MVTKYMRCSNRRCLNHTPDRDSVFFGNSPIAVSYDRRILDDIQRERADEFRCSLCNHDAESFRKNPSRARKSVDDDFFRILQSQGHINRANLVKGQMEYHDTVRELGERGLSTKGTLPQLKARLARSKRKDKAARTNPIRRGAARRRLSAEERRLRNEEWLAEELAEMEAKRKYLASLTEAERRALREADELKEAQRAARHAEFLREMEREEEEFDRLEEEKRARLAGMTPKQAVAAHRAEMRAALRKRRGAAKKRKNPSGISREMAGGLEEYRLTVRKLKAKGLSTKGKLPTLKRRLAAATKRRRK